MDGEFLQTVSPFKVLSFVFAAAGLAVGMKGCTLLEVSTEFSFILRIY